MKNQLDICAITENIVKICLNLKMKNQIQNSFTTTFEMYTFSSSNQRPESQVPIYQDYCSQGIMSQLERVMFLQDKQLVFQCMGLLPMLIENKTYFNVNTRYVV